MANPLFNRFGGQFNNTNNSYGGLLNILKQYRQLQNDPGSILDILLNNGKINQQQYSELQSVRNNPQQIVNYLSQHGNAGQLNQVQQFVNNVQNQIK